MTKVEELKKQLERGKVYRRSDLAKWSKSVDRHLDVLLKEDTLQKLSQGLYYFPEETTFGQTPPEDEVLVRSFLKDDRFLLTSPNAYNSLGVGTTQLYNQRIVYNHKRHGEFKLGNKKFSFRVKPHFPKKVTQEFLIVDLVNNLETLAEDQKEVLKNLSAKVRLMDAEKIQESVMEYGNAKTKKIFESLLSSK
ncbi:DUF6088 family protein [Flavobacterium sp. WC2509]|uniref:DUF6088 family protein n=1 Tax=Flavobacterium sp. WC2509 TaxID=3461406 RepID=UPI004043A1AE